MAKKGQGAALDRKKLVADPIMVGTTVVGLLFAYVEIYVRVGRVQHL